MGNSMTKDNFEFIDGGFLRDKFGRKELLARTKHQSLNPGDALVSGTVIDSDGREQVVFVDGPAGIPGPQGPPGAGVNWKGIWSSIVTYALGDGVSRNGLPFASNANGNLNHDPATDATNWTLFGGSPLGVDVWNSQTNPNSVTDWGPIINTLVSSGVRTLNFAAHVFPFSTQINAENTINITFQGEGGALYPVTSLTQPISNLLWKGGAASGTALSLRGTDGATIRNLGITYDSAAYNGDLISLDSTLRQCANATFSRCTIGQPDRANAIRSARTLLRLNNAVTVNIEESCLIGAQATIRGAETGSISDNIFILRNSFFNCSFAYIVDIARSWTIDSNTFNVNDGTSGPPNCIDFSVIPPQINFRLSNNQFWDMNPTVTTGVHIPATATAFMVADGNMIWNAMAGFKLLGAGNYFIVSNTWLSAFLNTGTVSPIDIGTTAKECVRILDNHCTMNLDAQPFIMGANIGHRHLTIDNASTDSVRTVAGQECASY